MRPVLLPALHERHGGHSGPLRPHRARPPQAERRGACGQGRAAPAARPGGAARGPGPADEAGLRDDRPVAPERVQRAAPLLATYLVEIARDAESDVVEAMSAMNPVTVGAAKDP